ncbi:protein kinase, partial [Nocardioides sp. CER28]
MQADRRGQSRAGAESRVDHDPLIGRTLDGRYRLTSRIARGGMAGVYEATDLRLDRTVAVKVMHSGIGGGSSSGHSDDGAYAARFVREARAAARLSHPHVVSVYDQGEDTGSPYLVMELVPGHTLRDTITTQSPMAPRRALALMEPVLSALAAAHRAGLVHRDVKPENVLISDDGTVKVADFGLARAVTADTQHTSTGVLIGTVSYIAPEIVTEGRADARADVYSAGVVLYELLTGRKPHEGETPIQVAYKHVHEDVPPPSRLVPSLPPYVDALVARATARDAGLRPADAGVMLRQVQRVASALAAGMSNDH